MDRELRVMTDISEGVKKYTTTTTYSSEMCTERREFQLDVGEKRVNVCTYKGTVSVDVKINCDEGRLSSNFVLFPMNNL